MTDGNGMTRRALLSAGAVLAAGAAAQRARAWTRGEGDSLASRAGVSPPAAQAVGARCWSELFPSGTDGRAVRLDEPVVLDVDAAVDSLDIGPGGALYFDPGSSATLASRGNVVVRGLLQLAPEAPRHLHVLRFVDVDESAFQGGGMTPVPSDVGLWVVDAGRLQLAGSTKKGWVRAKGGLQRGATTLELADVPFGWVVGDELAITPTRRPGAAGFDREYDSVRIRSISGRVLTLTAPLRFDHPATAVAPGLTMTAEVLNLTRNVVVEGTPTGRAHVWVGGSTAPVVRHTLMRHLGPRRQAGSYTASVLGRYALHLHMMGDASRGTTVEGAVVRDAGAHAYVAHASHGVTFRGCVSHATMDDAFWDDPPPDDRPDVVSNGLRYLNCVASLVTVDPPFRGYRLAGFSLGSGTGNEARGCVAVGVQGNEGAAGFLWPEGGDGVWNFASNVAHNNAVNGTFVWQNDGRPHVVKQLVSYHNGEAGAGHGAYRNTYRYENAVLHGNGLAGIVVHATSANAPLTFRNLLLDGAGISSYGFLFTKHTLPGVVPTRITSCRMLRHRVAGIGLTFEGPSGSSQPDVVDVTDCAFSGRALWWARAVPAESTIRIQSPGWAAQQVRRSDQPGTLRADWNARVRNIADFAPRGTARAAQPGAFPLGAPTAAAYTRSGPRCT